MPPNAAANGFNCDKIMVFVLRHPNGRAKPAHKLKQDALQSVARWFQAARMVPGQHRDKHSVPVQGYSTEHTRGTLGVHVRS